MDSINRINKIRSLKSINHSYRFEFAHALEPVDGRKVVLHIKVIEERERRVRPRPVDQRAELEDERRDHEAAIDRSINQSIKKSINL